MLVFDFRVSPFYNESKSQTEMEEYVMSVMILGRKELESVLKMDEVIEGVKSVYQLKARGDTVVWPLVSHEFTDKTAVMDIRSGGVFGSEQIHGLKMLNNFPFNKDQGLPPFNGMLMVFDSETGIPLGVMDAAYITCMRTGAAGAIGAQALARKDSQSVLLLGAGKQAEFQIAAILTAIPGIKRIFIGDLLDPMHGQSFAKECPLRLKRHFDITKDNCCFEAVSDLETAARESDIIITITPSRQPIIQKEWIRPGTHLSCIGADMEGKEEIDPQIFVKARIFADDIEQCIRVGELERPIRENIISKEAISGEIGQVLCGKKQGRLCDEDITIFDATGLALLDLVTGKRAIAQAKKLGLGLNAEI